MSVNITMPRVIKQGLGEVELAAEQVEAEKCREVRGQAQGRWKQKARWVASQEQGGYLGQFLFRRLWETDRSWGWLSWFLVFN
jgi:hypothetical protein